MPRAFDPLLPAGGLPITHSPLNRIRYNVIPQDLDLEALLEGVIEGLGQAIEDFLFPAIEELTGIDLSALLPLLDLLDLDFSSVEGFVASLVAAVLAFPAVLTELLLGLIQILGDLPETFGALLSTAIGLLVSLPEILGTLVTGVIDLIANTTGIDLSEFLPLLDALSLDFTSPTAFLTSLFAAAMALPGIVTEIFTGVAEQLLELLTGESGGLQELSNFLIGGLFGPITANRIPLLPVSHIGDFFTNLLAGFGFDSDATIDGGGVWEWDDILGHITAGAAKVIPNGTLKELLSHAIQVTPGQIIDVSGWAKWTGLASINTVKLGVTGYQGGAAIDVVTLITDASGLASTDWRELVGSYTVPPNVDSMRVRLLVDPAATAGTVWFDDIAAGKTGLMPQDLVKDLVGDLTALFGHIGELTADILQRVLQGDFDGLIDVLTGELDSTLEGVEERLDSFLDMFSDLPGGNIIGDIADDVLPSVRDLRDKLVNAVGRIDGFDFDIAAVSEVFEGQTHAVVDASSQLLSLFTRVSHLESNVAAMPPPVPDGGTAEGGAIGGTDTDTFERTSSSSLGTGWLHIQSGSGVWATPNGHDASFATSGTGNTDFLEIRSTGGLIRSATDMQRVSMVLSAKAGSAYLVRGHNDLWLRISDSSTSLSNVTGIRVRFGGDGSVSITRFLSGAATVLASLGSGGITPPGPGAVIIGEAGSLAGSSRYFRAMIGSSTRLQVTETGVASGMGAAYRRWGHGGRAEGHLIPPGQQKPGSAHQWSAMDQTVPTAGGDGPGTPGG